MTAAFLDLPIARMSAALRAGETGCRALAEAAIDRAAALQPLFNPFVAVLAERALARADALDAELRAGHWRGPLHGIPLAHKDCFERVGEPMTVGSAVIDPVPGQRDAAVLTRLEAAGAIDLGRLNLAEFVAGPTGQNPHLGDCRNAWDPERVSGGSSSGSGTAVALGIVAGSLGTDTGGSIRIPAAMNGLYGLKPTYGRVSRAGCFPRSHSLDTIGPLARTAEDCALILQAVAGADPGDPTALAAPVPDYAARLADASRGSRIGLIEEGLEDLEPSVAAAFATFRAAVADCFGAVEPRPFPALASCYALGDTVSKVDAATLHGAWMAERPERYSQAVFSRTEVGLHVPAPRYLEALALRARILQRVLDETFAGLDVLLCPTVPIPTPTRAEADMEQGERVFPVVAAITRLTRPFSYLGLPVLTVPAGLDANGMPVGAQLVGRPFGEARLLSIGARLAEAAGWRGPPGWRRTPTY